MKVRFVLAAVCAVIALTSVSSRAQDVATTSAPVSTTAPVPHYVRYGGTVSESGSKPQQMRFSLYENQTGGQAVWSETQTVTPSDGKYAVLLGAGTEGGLPQNVFSAGQARWLGISVGAGQEQPRTILLATPYSLESSDAQTLAGHPVTDFVLAGANSGASSGNSKAKPNTTTDISQIDVTTGLTITNGGTGPTVTMGIDATKIPFLTTANSFTGTQTISLGNLAIPATTSKTSGVITAGGVPIYQAYSKTASANNLFLGAGSGNFTNSGKNNTGVGNESLGSLTTSAGDVGLGVSALARTSSGSYNTGIGGFAGYYNTTGNYNTYIGNSAGPASGNGNFSNSAAIGANAIVGESNALVLGGTGANAVSVGIGTATPQYTLDVQGTANFTGAINYAGVQTITGSLDSATKGMLTATNNEANCPDECVGVWGIAGVANDDQVGVVGYGYFGTYGYGGTYGVFGDGSQYGVFGNGDTGVEGYGDTTGVYAQGTTYGAYASGDNYGTYSVSNEVGGSVGIFGDYFNLSNEYTTFANAYAGTGEGAWGDGGGTGTGGQGIGVAGTSDTSYGVAGGSSSTYPAVYARSDWDTSGGTGYMFEAYSTSTGDQCTIDTSSNVVCDGGFNPSVVGVDKRHIETYSSESSENWIDDYGSGQLQNGRATVAIHPDFANITNTGVEYHVFLTPKGESENLYVLNETSTGFEVREAHNGGSNIAFDYRIVAKRLGSESGRLVDITAQRRSGALAMKVPAGKPAMRRPGGLVMPPPPAHRSVKRTAVATSNSNAKH